MSANNKYLATAIAAVVIAVGIISLIGMALSDKSPIILQGEVESTQIKISGKLIGRVDKFYVAEGSSVKKGDTLVLINSPETDAMLQSASAIKDAAEYQNQKVDAGARDEIIASLKAVWEATKAELEVAQSTNARIERLYRDSVVTLQRKEEVNALAHAAQAAEATARYQYQMALKGAQKEDKESSKAMVEAAQGSVNEVKALLQDTKLISPANGEISDIYPTIGELVMPGATIMNIVDLNDTYVILNIREDMLQNFSMGKVFKGEIPALAGEQMDFKVYHISPLGSYATWQSNGQNDSYNLVTFKVKAKPTAEFASQGANLRPGMSVIVKYRES